MSAETTVISAPKSSLELLTEEFITIEALAEFTGKSVRTLNWWRETKQGPPYVKIGKTVLYRKSAFLKWLIDGEVQPRKRKAGPR